MSPGLRVYRVVGITLGWIFLVGVAEAIRGRDYGMILLTTFGPILALMVEFASGLQRADERWEAAGLHRDDDRHR